MAPPEAEDISKFQEQMGSLGAYSPNYGHPDPPSNPAMGYEARCKLLFQAGSGTQPQQHEQFWLIWRPGTASGSKGFFLYYDSKV